MTARTFGRKGQGDDAEMARRREAFIAEERARKERLAQQPEQAPAFDKPAFGKSAALPGRPIFVAEKTVGTAYLLWFFCGAISAHRHYLGYSSSGFLQAGLWFGGWLAILMGELWLWPAPVLVGLWVLCDAFLIPGMTRDANAQIRARAAHLAFT